eukprot:TRINITY_DN18027_c0_g1_i1.p1 TRINITY_DN18027_c0_g1~~TRINITY_DN18027_c0_g1_i1.p1  ORF type:complete len:245 (+),score=43.44 TRINITY_DN18027_c0_g1_i1:96-737(+)
MAKYISEFPRGTIITGGPLGNLYLLLKYHPTVQLETVFVQGGFAGANCVPLENQLPKFKHMYTCPTFNFSAHIPGANALLSSQQIFKKHLISKDVCHGVAWDQTFHSLAVHFKGNSSEIWKLLIAAMGSYKQKKSEGKMLHDPLAACTAIDPSIIQFCEVTVNRENGKWGSKPKEGTNTWISIGANKTKFYSVFLEVEQDKIVEFLNKKARVS